MYITVNSEMFAGTLFSLTFANRCLANIEKYLFIDSYLFNLILTCEFKDLRIIRKWKICKTLNHVKIFESSVC